MIRRVRIQSDPKSPIQTWITNAETGETVPGVKNIDIHIAPMELPVATMEILTEFDGVAEPIWKPAFDRAGRCEACRWWGGQGLDEYGGCAAPSGDRVMTRDLVTRGDFGCVQWEPQLNDER